MKPALILLFTCLCLSHPAQALVIYKNGVSLVTGTWNSNGTLTQTSANQPYEGTQHYSFVYNTVSTWAGFGLNMDNWYNGPAQNFSGFTHFRIAYRGLSANHVLNMQLRQGQNVYGVQYQIGGSTSTYTLLDIPMSALVGTSGIDLTQISELFFSVTSSGTTTGTVYVDAIELVNLAPPPASTAWDETNLMGKSFNLSNWLEAYWLLPFNAYPEVTKYVRADISFLKNAGFKTIRLPVIFEKLANPNPPYTLNTSNVAYALVDSAIAWANAFNMNLIIDNHHGYDLTNSTYQTEKARKCAIWRQLAQRYGALNSSKFYFELYNEPTNDISNANLRTVFTAVIDTIRLWDANQILIVGGNGWNSANGLTSSEPYYDPNIIYTFHTYDPFNFTHQGFSWTGLPTGVTFPQGSDLQDMANLFQSVKDWSTTWNMPVFLGEYGVGSWADATSRCAWIQAISDNINLQSFPASYWSPKYTPDDFGFFQNSILSAANAIPCFVSAMGLSLQPVSIEMISAHSECREDYPEFVWEANAGDVGAFFEIQHSADGLNWEEADQLIARPGQHTYHFRDESGKWNLYRLAYHFPDGRQEYSPIVRSVCKNDRALQLFPNPSAGDVTLTLNAQRSSLSVIQVCNAQGSQVLRLEQELTAGLNQFKVPVANLPQGYYVVSVLSEEGNLEGVTPFVKY